MAETVNLPFRLDAVLTKPDGTVYAKVRVVHRTDGMVTAIALGEVILQTYVEGDVTMEGGAYLVPTAQGVVRLAPMSDCGCGG